MNQNQTIDSNLLRQIFFIIVIIVLGLVLFELWFFLSAFLGAITFYVIMRQRMFFLTEKKGWKPIKAAWVLMLLSFFVILVPIGLLANIMYSKISYVVTHSSDLIASLKRMTDEISKNIGYEIVKKDNINKLGTRLAELLPKI